MAITDIHLDNLPALEDYLTTKYFSYSIEDRKRYLFRGQRDSSWRLTPSLDRQLPSFGSTQERTQYIELLLADFQTETEHLSEQIANMELEDVEHLARHHDLPTRLLDWSSSPYVALFFAFDSHLSAPSTLQSDKVSLWTLNSDEINVAATKKVEVVRAGFIGNPRAQSQRSFFTKLLSNDKSVDAVIPDALTHITLPAAMSIDLLQRLDEMNINAATLLGDLDGYAMAAGCHCLTATAGVEPRVPRSDLQTVPSEAGTTSETPIGHASRDGPHGLPFGSTRGILCWESSLQLMKARMCGCRSCLTWGVDCDSLVGCRSARPFVAGCHCLTVTTDVEPRVSPGATAWTSPQTSNRGC